MAGLDPDLGQWLKGIQSSGQDPVEQAILARYGYMGAFLHHPEIGPLLRQAATNGWTKEILQGALFKTQWYQKTSATSRQWALLQSSDPAEAKRLVAQKRLDLQRMAEQAGLPIPGGNLDAMAQFAIAANWTENETKAAIAASAKYDPMAKQQFPGTFLEAQQKVKALAYDQLMPMSDQSAFSWAQGMLAGRVTEEAVTSSLRQQAISRFPQFADELNHGVAMKQIAMPYAEQAAKLLEVNPETIDMTDAKYARMIDTRDDAGQKASMSLSDAATYVRSMNEWQYTENAHQEAAGMAESIAKTFGKVGGWLMPTTTASQYLKDVLAQYGLDNMTDWAMQQLTQGQSEEQIVISMRDQPEYQARFPAIKMRTDAGLPALTPAQYIEYERNTRQLMMQAGMPSGFYDQPDDFTDLLTKDISLNELTQRVQSGFDRVNSAPQEVSDAFNAFYGVQGQAALAQFYLDPERALPDLMRQAEAAVFGGTGQKQGIGVDRERSEMAARMGITQDQAQKGFQNLAQESDYYDELFTDTNDLSQTAEGVEATFGMNAEAERAVMRRKQQRQAAFGGQRGVVEGQQGLTGTGAATK